MTATRLAPLFVLTAALAAGCTPDRATRPYQEPPPPGLRPTRIDYADADAFDAVLETALTNQEPVILIQTRQTQPDWGPRLNAWLAAWNLGGPVEGGAGRTVRFQSPLPRVVVDGDSIREFRLLVEGLMTRAEGLARVSSAWWAEERTRARRVALLRPYNLRFHQDEEGFVQIILFNGRYADQYAGYVRSIARPADDSDEAWARVVSCSRCKQARGTGEGGD
jgi:hypothetical protein